MHLLRRRLELAPDPFAEFTEELAVSVPDKNWETIQANSGKLYLKSWPAFDGCVPFFSSPAIMPGPSCLPLWW